MMFSVFFLSEDGIFVILFNVSYLEHFGNEYLMEIPKRAVSLLLNYGISIIIYYVEFWEYGGDPDYSEIQSAQCQIIRGILCIYVSMSFSTFLFFLWCTFCSKVFFELFGQKLNNFLSKPP